MKRTEHPEKLGANSCPLLPSPADSCCQQLFKSWRPGDGHVSSHLLETGRGPAEGRGLPSLSPGRFRTRRSGGQRMPTELLTTLGRGANRQGLEGALCLPLPQPPARAARSPLRPLPARSLHPASLFLLHLLLIAVGGCWAFHPPHSCRPPLPWLRGREPEQLGQPASSIVVPGAPGERVSPRNRLSPGKKEQRALKAGQETVNPFSSKAGCRPPGVRGRVHTGAVPPTAALVEAPRSEREERAGTLDNPRPTSSDPLRVCLQPPGGRHFGVK